MMAIQSSFQKSIMTTWGKLKQTLIPGAMQGALAFIFYRVDEVLIKYFFLQRHRSPLLPRSGNLRQSFRSPSILKWSIPCGEEYGQVHTTGALVRDLFDNLAGSGSASSITT